MGWVEPLPYSWEVEEMVMPGLYPPLQALSGGLKTCSNWLLQNSHRSGEPPLSVHPEVQSNPHNRIQRRCTLEIPPEAVRQPCTVGSTVL